MALDIPLLTLESSPAAFLRALSTTGFLHLALPAKGNLTAVDVKKQFAVASHLYNEISLAERERYSRDEDANFNGYFGLGSTYLNREGGQQKADWKEGYGYGRFPEGANWDQDLPEGMENNRGDMKSFQDGCYELMLLVLDKLSEAFDVGPAQASDRAASIFMLTSDSCQRTTSGIATNTKAQVALRSSTIHLRQQVTTL